MAKRRELSVDIRKKIIAKHKKLKGYKSISKDLGVPVSTVRNVIKKFAAHGTVLNQAGRGRKRKIDQKSLRRLVRTIKKTPCATVEDLKVDLERSGTVVSATTVRRALNQEGLCGRRGLLKRTHKKKP